MTHPTNEPMSREQVIETLELLGFRLADKDGFAVYAIERAIAAMRREGDLLESLAKIKHVINDECESWCFYCGESNPNYGPVVHKEDCLWLGVISQHAPQQPPPGARGQ